MTDMLRYSFRSDVLATGTFGVVRFAGEEGLSRCYRFEILLVSEEAEIDLRKVLANPVKLAIHRETGGDVIFHGLPISFEQLQQVGKSVFYRVVMTPKLWRLSLTRHNQVFLNKTIPEIIEACLKDGGLTSLDYELRFQKDYSPWEYICQYEESHLDFVSRWLEHEGLYYYFEDTDTGEKVIITDSRIAHSAMPQGLNLTYLPPSGLESAHRDEIISAFFCRQQLLPQTVVLKDYNYRRPSLELTATAQVHPEGHGEIYSYGEHFRTPEEGQALAKIRAEEINCWERRFEGESSVPYLRPGYLFKLTDHYRKSFNQEYLTVLITHAGNQAGYTLSGLSATLADGEQETYYRNAFTALPAEVQFRPERKTPKALLHGFLNARIDAAGSGQYAELDDQGRYKILLPFDRSGRKDGKASAWVRMMQPYAGSDHGMHFPLHKGTEVMLAFIDGDPDRPVIAGAVPNPETPSLINADNQTKSRIVSSSGNEFHMEDEAGKERILMNSPSTNTFIRLGQPNDPPADWAKPMDTAGGKWGYTLNTPGWISITGGTSNTMIIGENTAVTLINDNKFVGGIRTDTTVGIRFNFPVGGENKAGPFELQWVGIRERANANKVITAGNKVNVIASLNKVIGNKVQTAALDSELDALRNQMIADYTKAMATRTSALATINEVVTAMGNVVAESTTAAASQVRAAASVTEAIAQKATAVANSNKVNTVEVNAALSTIKNAIVADFNSVVTANVDGLNAIM
jgi:type VI secretion system secreted protein VgrG